MKIVNWKKIGVFVLKLFVFVVAWAYVVYKFTTTEQDVSIIFSSSDFSIIVFAVVCLLMLYNWGLEARKWQKLVCCSQSISYRKAISGVLVGLPLALITPNRIGEIGGRAIVLESGRRNAIFATFLGSLTQLASTLIFGVIGLVSYLAFCSHSQTMDFVAWICLVSLVVIVILLLVCRKMRWFKVVFLTLAGKKFYRKLVQMIGLYTRRSVVTALIFSLLRYCVFSGQFVLLLKMLLPELSIVILFVGVTITYLVTTIIPTSVLGEIGIRGSVAMFVFETFTQNVSIIFQVSFLVWIVNIVVPTLVGSVILLNVRQRKS